ncbi:MAG TPA: efflux RND transporter periplasmic adaptor subunit [Gemmatimonadaceae bacterium]|nr:efflux RND transporter periplasmic adaptor subunit [Gemmatimonadaceae bacterium]
MTDEIRKAHDETATAAPRWRRRLLQSAGLAIAAIIAVVAWAMLARGRDERRARAGRQAAAGGAMAGMPGMEGMRTSGGSGSARLTAEQIRHFGVTFGTVEQRTLTSEVRAAGVVVVDETRVAEVAPRFGGFVERLYADFTGQAVSRGQPLLEVYSPELLAAQQELLVAVRLGGETTALPGAPASGAGDLVAAARRRLELSGVSEAQIAEVLRAGEPRRTLTVHSPAAGVVVEKRVVRGQSFEAGQTLYTIADLSEVWVEAELRESDVGSARVGSGAEVELTGLPGRRFKGRVRFIAPTLDSATRTVRARVVVSNSERQFKPGMYATVRISAPTRAALTVPSSAVVRTGERSLVFVDMGGGELMPHDVETGRVAGDLTEILSGVEPGQRVVTSAQFLLDSESNLAEVMRSMIGQTGSSDMGDMKGVPMPVPAAPASGGRRP